MPALSATTLWPGRYFIYQSRINQLLRPGDPQHDFAQHQREQGRYGQSYPP